MPSSNEHESEKKEDFCILNATMPFSSAQLEVGMANLDSIGLIVMFLLVLKILLHKLKRLFRNFESGVYSTPV